MNTECDYFVAAVCPFKIENKIAAEKRIEHKKFFLRWFAPFRFQLDL